MMRACLALFLTLQMMSLWTATCLAFEDSDLPLMHISSADAGASPATAADSRPLPANDNCLSDNCACGDCGCDCGHCGTLLGFVVPSDHCFDDFISPITNPVNFEDPRTLTEARAIFINHWVPSAVGGNQLQVYALQIRAALTDRLSIIATKDGYVVSQNPLVEDGWANIAAGLKYNVWKDPCEQRVLSAGATYEMPFGSTRTLQGLGSGVFHLFLTGGMEVGGFHWISDSGFRLADSSDQSDLWYWSNHLDHRIGGSNFYGLFESNWFHWIKDGNNPTFSGIEGNDFFNLGSTNVAGTDIVDVAFGLKYKPNGNLEIGAAFEVPVSQKRDLLEDRLTVDAILRY